MWNSWVLLVAQALNGAGGVAMIAFGALAGAYLLGPDKSLATLPPAGYSVGLALGALPAALLMQRVGRRLGFIAGNTLGIAGCVAAGFAVLGGSFVAFVAALGLVGVAAAFIQQYRFAAAEGAPPNLRGVAISRVMIGGVVTALAGPPIILATRDLFDPVPFAGSFFAVAGLTVVGLLVLTRLRPVPPAIGPGADASARRFSEIARQPRFIVSLLCATTSVAMMTFAMTAAPLAIVGHHHSEAE
ncbi:MAG: MFS transporter, partial [Bauldia sp.]